MNPSFYDTLCDRARALALDAEFISSSPARLDFGEVLRLALDLVPTLELLPLPILAEELRGVLARLGGARTFVALP